MKHQKFIAQFMARSAEELTTSTTNHTETETDYQNQHGPL